MTQAKEFFTTARNIEDFRPFTKARWKLDLRHRRHTLLCGRIGPGGQYTCPGFAGHVTWISPSTLIGTDAPEHDKRLPVLNLNPLFMRRHFLDAQPYYARSKRSGRRNAIEKEWGAATAIALAARTALTSDRRNELASIAIRARGGDPETCTDEHALLQHATRATDTTRPTQGQSLLLEKGLWLYFLCPTCGKMGIMKFAGFTS